MSQNHKLTDEDFQKINYINLKNHSGYSLLLGLGGSKKHIKETHKKGHKGVAFTDNGVMMGCLDLYNQARDKKVLESIGFDGKKYPIIMGASLYITQNTLLKNPENKYSGITLLIKNQLSYENLCLLTSISSQEEKFYVKPRMDFLDLLENKKDLIVLSGGFHGFLGTAIHEKHGVLKNLFLRFFSDIQLSDTIFYYMERVNNFPDRGYELIQQIAKITPQFDLSEDEIQVFSTWLAWKTNFELLKRLLKSPDMQRLIKSYEKKFPIEREVYQSVIHTNLFEDLSEDDKTSYLSILENYYPEVYVEWFKAQFGDDFYLEINPHDLRMKWVREEKRHIDTGSNPQEFVNQKLVELGTKYNIKLVLVQDSYIPDKEQHIIQSIQIWNSPGGKDGWYFYDALEIMDIPTMYEKLITNYPWVSDDQFIEWSNNSYEILQKCKDCELEFKPSLPTINYEEHYVNKVPTVIKRKLILDLQELSLWNEDIKERIIQNKSIKNETVPDWLKEKYQTEEACIDFDDMKKREKENIFLEDTLIKMKKHYKNEKDFLKLITRSEKDLAMRTALKVMMRYQKLLPKSIDEAKLDAEIEKRMPGKKRSDFKQDAIDKFIIKMNLYKKSDDPMLLLGDRPTRERLIEESNTIQYNGILRLINYFMLLEDITNFVNENNYLRGFGRGSGAGSIVAYALDITDCQPIENGLLFERFLTTERIGEKDVELDGFSWKEFLSKKNQSRIEISQEDLILTDDEMDDQSIDDMIDGDME